MPSNLLKTSYPYEEMKLQRLFKNENINMPTLGIKSNNLTNIYGEDLMFPEIPEYRPYTYTSLVLSIDGRIAFADAPEGPFVASKNYLSGQGALVDWWTLNVLRASADGIIFGANTLNAEEESTGHIYDEELEAARETLGMSAIPWNIIPTLDGSDIPFNHKEFNCEEIPIIFYTSPVGSEACIENAKKETIVLGPFNKLEEVDFEEFTPDRDKVYVVITGEGKFPDNKVGLKVLRKMGIKKLLVESPTLTHIFMQEKIIDELFFNYSCIYLGGKSLGIGQNGREFTSINHPHTELVSIYMHSPHFMYLRHRLIYGVKDPNRGDI